MKILKKLSAAITGLSITVTAAVSSVTPMTFTVSAAEDYENFAKALQYVLYFYDANMCGYDKDPKTGEKAKKLEWRGDCHTEDYNIPLQPIDEEGADARYGTNLSQEFIDEYRDILDPDGDGFMDCGGGFHDAGDHVIVNDNKNVTFHNHNKHCY